MILALRSAARRGAARPALRTALLAATIGVGGALSSGCAGELVATYPVVEADVVPVEIYTYPHVIYAGSDAYLVNDRWYYRSRGRWVVFRREPRELEQYRVDYHRRRAVPGGSYEAPAAHRRRNRP